MSTLVIYLQGDNMETTGAFNGDLSKETPTEEFNYLILLVLLVVPIAAIVIGLVICKLKSCGPWQVICTIFINFLQSVYSGLP